MMKINRLIARPRSLGEIVRADGLVYSRSELVEILEMISEGNRSSGGITKVCSAFGLLGFVRFLDCYYFTLVTQRREVGCIAGNYVYSVKATEMFPVRPRDEPEANTFRKMWKKLNKKLNQTSAEIAESRYMGLFQFVDVTKDFFFSYSYDLTNSLQRNFLVCNNLAATGSSSATATSTGVAGENGRTTKPTGGPAEEKVEGNNGSSCTDGGVGGSGAAAGNTKAIPAPQEIFEWNYFQMHGTYITLCLRVLLWSIHSCACYSGLFVFAGITCVTLQLSLHKHLFVQWRVITICIESHHHMYYVSSIMPMCLMGGVGAHARTGT